jgi:hypothetical protein
MEEVVVVEGEVEVGLHMAGHHMGEEALWKVHNIF